MSQHHKPKHKPTHAQGGLHSYRLHGKPPEDELPDIAPDQVAELQGQLMKAGFAIGTKSHPDGKDGMVGWLTFDALKHVAQEAKVNLHDVSFRTHNDAYTKFMSALNTHIQSHDKVAETLQSPQPAGPTPEQLAAQEAARRAAAEAAARAAEEARIPPSIRGTQYDPRYLRTVSDAELNNILKDGLHGIGEISKGFLGTGSYHRNGELGEVTTSKVFEQERKLLGIPRGQETMSRWTLEATAAALGDAVVRRHGYALAPVSAGQTVPQDPAMASALGQAQRAGVAGVAMLPASGGSTVPYGLAGQQQTIAVSPR